MWVNFQLFNIDVLLNNHTFYIILELYPLPSATYISSIQIIGFSLRTPYITFVFFIKLLACHVSHL